MKKRDVFFSAFLSLAVLASTGAADVVKISVRLVPEPGFGAGVDWNSVFTLYRGPFSHRGIYKDFVRLGDGRFIVMDSQTYNFLLFDADGRFVKKIWKKGRRRADDLSIDHRPEWLSLWEDRYLFVSEPGVIRVFDLDGREIRHAAIVHSVKCLVPLGEGLVAVAGDVPRKDLPVRYVDAVFDLAKGTETVVADSIESRPEKRFLTGSADGWKTWSVSFPFAQVRPFVRGSADGGFLTGFTNWPEIEVYDKTGKQIRTFMLKTEPAMIEWSLIRAQAPLAIEREEESKKRLPLTSEGKIVGTGYGYYLRNMPYFYNLYIDDRGDLLVFYFPKEGKNPVYQVYSSAGDLLREVVVETGDYVIPFSPGAAGAVFADGYLYALAEIRGLKEPSLRLMKFKMAEK